jgi:hypothetical protein
LIKEYESEYPNLIDIYRAKLWIKEKIAIAKEKNDAIEEYESIDQLCDEALEIHPYDGETMAIQAKAKLELGNKEEAMELPSWFDKNIEKKEISAEEQKELDDILKDF